MKVVILMGSLTMGGAERVATTLAAYLAEHCIETYLVSFDNKESSYVLSPKVNFINNKVENIHGKISGIKQRINFMFNTIDSIKPDLVFTMFYHINIYALIYKWFGKSKIKLVSSERCNPNESKGLKRILTKISSCNCDGFIFQTERAKKCYPKKVQDKSVVIHNAIGNPLFKKIDENKIMTEKTITSMGRLEYQKAHDVMIKSCAPVLKKHPEYKLVIYGEGSLRPYLEDLINKLDMQNNVFLPGNTESALLEVAKSQVFLLTSRFEGMPNALMEAMACGVPSISTDCDMGPAELISDGENGYLVPVDDVDAITQKLELLIDDERLRKQISNNSRKIVEEHSVQKIYREYLDYFLRIVNNS